MINPFRSIGPRMLLAVTLIVGGGSLLLIGPDRARAQDAPVAPVVASIGEDGVQRADIVLDSYSYSPSHLIVRVGTPVELTLSSVTFLTPHNFILRDAAAGLDINQDVGAGKTVPVRFTPTQAGRFAFYCDKQLLFFASHREKGMEGILEVRP